MKQLLFICLLICNTLHITVGNEHPFIPNKGQWADEICYRAAIPGGYLFIAKNGFQLAYYDYEKLQYLHDMRFANTKDARLNTIADLSYIAAHGVGISFLGAKTPQAIRPHNPSPNKYHYYLGADTTKWASGLQGYQEVVLADIYAGIDCHFIKHQLDMKYEFHLHKGADASQIQLLYTGAESLSLKNGHLYIKTSINEYIEQRPFSYQIIAGKKVAVVAHFKLVDNIISYEFPEGYDKHHPLIIDPILVFSTFSGSMDDNWGNTATYDLKENLYAGGISFGQNFPFTEGAYQVDFAGQQDVVVMKFDSLGQNLLYSSFLGGEALDVPHSLVVNFNNELLVLGTTGSTTFPTTSQGFQKTFAGGNNETPIGGLTFNNGSDMFIGVLSEDGSSLLGATYLGGSGNDGVNISAALAYNYGDQLRGDIITDSLNNIYIVCTTRSTDFPTSVNAPQRNIANPATSDAIVAKLTPYTDSVVWATYFGGNSDDTGFSVKIDPTKNILIGGGTASNNLPTTTGVIYPTFNGGGSDGYLLKISADGTNILACTYVGTDNRDQVFFIDQDPVGNVAALGLTFGTYPVTPGIYTNPNSGQFIHKLSPDFSATVFSTVIGSGRGTPDIAPTAFLLNECGNIYISGWGGLIGTTSTNMLPVTTDAFQSTTDGADFYLMLLTNDGEDLIYATFLGGTTNRGEHLDGGTCRFSPRGTVYHAVCSCVGLPNIIKPNFPTTEGAYSQTHGSSNCNLAAFKFDLEILKSRFQSSTTSGCAPLTVTFQNQSLGASQTSWKINQEEVSISDSSFTYTFEEGGTYIIGLELIDPSQCITVSVAYDTIIVFAPTFDNVALPTDPTVCKGESITLNITGGARYLWEKDTTLTDPTSSNPTVTPTTSRTYKVTIFDANGCSQKEEVSVEVIEDVYAAFDFSYENQCGEPPLVSFQNLSENATIFLWDLGDGRTFATEKIATKSYPFENKTYTVSLLASNGTCTDRSTRNLTTSIIHPPNTFTPNKDGYNDKFIVDNITDGWHFTIYNRWGKTVYETASYQGDWMGKDTPAGSYFYQMTSPEKYACKGIIYLIK